MSIGNSWIFGQHEDRIILEDGAKVKDNQEKLDMTILKNIVFNPNEHGYFFRTKVLNQDREIGKDSSIMEEKEVLNLIICHPREISTWCHMKPCLSTLNCILLTCLFHNIFLGYNDLKASSSSLFTIPPTPILLVYLFFKISYQLQPTLTCIHT